MHCLYFICKRKVCTRTHVKIARHFKSTLREVPHETRARSTFALPAFLGNKATVFKRKTKRSKCSSLWLAKRTAVVCEMIISASDSPGHNEEIILTQSWVKYENYLQQVRCSGWPRPRTAKITKVQVEQPGKEIIKWELDCAAIGRLKTFYDQRSIHPLYIWVPYFVYRKRF